MTKEIEEEPVYTGYTGGYIPFTDLTQDDIDKIKQMIDRLKSNENLFFISSEEEIKE